MLEHHSVSIEKYQIICKATMNVVLKYPKISASGSLGIKGKTKGVVKNLLKRIFYGVKRDYYNWPNAHMIIGLQKAFEHTNDPAIIALIESYYDRWYDAGSKINNLDNVMNGYALLDLLKIKSKNSYISMIDKMISFIDNHPKDKQHSLPYRVRRPDIYIDSLGMICPFLCKYSSMFNEPQYAEVAIEQILNFHKYGFDKKSGLPYHGYCLGKKEKYGIIGWGRAIGWLMISLADSLEHIPKDNSRYNQCVALFKDLSHSVIQYQKDHGAFSWQITTVEGPDDTSTTCMVAYSILKGIKLGILTEDYINSVNRATEYLLESTDDEGFVQNCSAECEGFSQYPQRYGWFPWGQGYTLALLSIIQGV